MSEIERLKGEAKREADLIRGDFESCDKLHAIIDALAAAKVAGASSAEPVGWKLVPVEPTEEMRLAGTSGKSFIVEIWSLMLAAAPTASAESSAEQIGRDARMRAAGMSALLGEVMAQNARRDLDDDFVDRIERAIADQEAATSSAAPTPSDPQANNWRDAYEGAREDLLLWKRRAQKAEQALAAHPSAQPVPARQPLTRTGVIAGWQVKTSNTARDQFSIDFFEAGVRFAERAHGISVAAPTPSDPQVEPEVVRYEVCTLQDNDSWSEWQIVSKEGYDYLSQYPTYKVRRLVVLDEGAQ